MTAGLCARCVLDACMRDSVHFMVGVWVVCGVVVGPILGSVAAKFNFVPIFEISCPVILIICNIDSTRDVKSNMGNR
jgi:hypothetical protein